MYWLSKLGYDPACSANTYPRGIGLSRLAAKRQPDSQNFSSNRFMRELFAWYLYQRLVVTITPQRDFPFVTRFHRGVMHSTKHLVCSTEGFRQRWSPSDWSKRAPSPPCGSAYCTGSSRERLGGPGSVETLSNPDAMFPPLADTLPAHDTCFPGQGK